MQYYAHKKYLVRFDEMQEDGVLDTQCASISFLKGDKLATDCFGNKWVVSKGQDEEYYVPVELKLDRPRKKPSPFEEEYTKKFFEMSTLNQNEDEEYIKGTRKISKL
jgi:hypothetical protein